MRTSPPGFPSHRPSGHRLEIFFSREGDEEYVNFVHLFEGGIDFDEGKRLEELKELFICALAAERKAAS